MLWAAHVLARRQSHLPCALRMLGSSDLSDKFPNQKSSHFETQTSIQSQCGCWNHFVAGRKLAAVDGICLSKQLWTIQEPKWGHICQICIVRTVSKHWELCQLNLVFSLCGCSVTTKSSPAGLLFQSWSFLLQVQQSKFLQRTVKWWEKHWLQWKCNVQCFLS